MDMYAGLLSTRITRRACNPAEAESALGFPHPGETAGLRVNVRRVTNLQLVGHESI
jgi:hypothetical protein